MARIDLHVHPRRGLTAASVLRACRRHHLDGVALCGQGTLQRARRLRDQLHRLTPDLLVIIGQEVELAKHHVLVLGIPEDAQPIETGQNLQKAVADATRMGALSVLAHPCSKSPWQAVRGAPDGLHALETLNARHALAFPHGPPLSRVLAKRWQLGMVGGSDGFTEPEVGQAWTGFDGPPQDWRNAILEGRTVPAGKGYLPVPAGVRRALTHATGGLLFPNQAERTSAPVENNRNGLPGPRQGDTH